MQPVCKFDDPLATVYTLLSAANPSSVVDGDIFNVLRRGDRQ